jgi:aromatic ring-opening dioxygenase catalytic subunit (LigB family)
MNTSETNQKPRMPALFIPHGGGPCFFMDWDPKNEWDKMANYLRNIASGLPAQPKAVVMVSAHWIQSEVTVTSAAHPEMIFDYDGFPANTYELRYPAPGEPGLAEKLVHLLKTAGIQARTNETRGYDHGMFIPMLLMFPEANIPVIQMSLTKTLNPEEHIAIGQALESLRDEGVLIVGSGMSFHNMRGYGDPRYGPISDIFDTWLTQSVESDPHTRNKSLAHWEDAPGARQCHPPGAEEHLIPLMVVSGAAGQDKGVKAFTDRVMQTTISAFHFG